MGEHGLGWDRLMQHRYEGMQGMALKCKKTSLGDNKNTPQTSAVAQGKGK